MSVAKCQTILFALSSALATAGTTSDWQGPLCPLCQITSPPHCKIRNGGSHHPPRLEEQKRSIWSPAAAKNTKNVPIAFPNTMPDACRTLLVTSHRLASWDHLPFFWKYAFSMVVSHQVDSWQTPLQSGTSRKKTLCSACGQGWIMSNMCWRASTAAAWRISDSAWS